VVPSAEDECLGLEPGKGPKVGRDEDATLVIVTHGAPDANLHATVEDLRQLPIVRSIASVLRVEGGS